MAARIVARLAGPLPVRLVAAYPLNVTSRMRLGDRARAQRR